MENMREIVDKLNLWAYHYYTLDEPLVSDAEYDKLYDELLKLEKKTGIVLDNSPTQRVGGDVLEKFEKHIHLQELYSLQKAQSIEELREFCRRCEKFLKEYNSLHNVNKKLEYYVEFKFDGLTINLTYDNGKLISASTRGNGIYGEEVFEQVKTIKSIPLEIDYNGLVEIQGEAIMPLSALKKYNELNEIPLKNARNAAAGAIRNLDPKKTAQRNLDAFIYNVGFKANAPFKTQEEMIDFLRKNKFKVNNYEKKCETLEQIIEKIQEIEKLRKEVDYLTDGAVIKVNDFELREYFGYTNKFPRFAIAYKFEAQEYSTILKDVVWNVGRSGKVTPTAILEEVEIGDVTVKRATLNNYDDIQRKNVKINSRVLVRRSNDVIPEILGVLPSEDSNEIEILPPTHCPFCKSELIKDGVHIFCTNTLGCTPQLISSLVHFSSKTAMNIEGLSEKTIESLFENLKVDTVYKIYDLTFEKLLTLDKFKEKKAKNLLNSIEKSKNVNLENFIYALGIKNVGIKTAKDLAKKYKNLDSLRVVTEEELLEIQDIGEVVARCIFEFFNDEYSKKSLDLLLSKGIKIESYKDITENEFTDKKVVITGTFENYKRSDLENFFSENGLIVQSSVGKSTDFLIVGEKAGSKLKKALELGVEIISQENLEIFLKKVKN
ncbi:MAG: NAD-dependent DNA ligase LigA [Peptoniphilaceae bacterium]|uniref:NAD-dependent DNA ligase LigA n=1 Tax=Parvimonas sp. TaxID=1944660 RepID=UPI0025D7747D|nr:NAD-dependent DNA ligase LigA [Parvimonas sp.]MCI5997099.1 NAD-dependent DNA ligase LigA [Parvimonas sp.]MDD7765371.1 NAD-dependent DNA ligase LigA [Peptoniphilaceae bacterium]MDY3051264.1 NAD-dependent DNA ligase LigA [Parvimonas sp.]